MTGGSRGIGLMITRGLVEAVAKVYVSTRKAEACEEAVLALSAPGQAVVLPADLSREEECHRLAADIGEREERLHITVNNAGAAWGAPLDEFPVSGWHKVMDLNLRSLLLTQACLPKLRAGGSTEDPARIINVGSIDGLHLSQARPTPMRPARRACTSRPAFWPRSSGHRASP